jgi:uncharacterized protein (TIGR02246 family)
MSSITDTTRAVVADYVRALQTGDAAALRAAFAPDATWTLPGDLPVSGTWVGPEGILDDFLARLVSRLDPTAPVEQELHRIVADGDVAVAEWTSTARSLAGVAYRNDYAVVFRVQDGRIAAVTEYTDLDHMRKVLFPETVR